MKFLALLSLLTFSFSSLAHTLILQCDFTDFEDLATVKIMKHEDSYILRQITPAQFKTDTTLTAEEFVGGVFRLNDYRDQKRTLRRHANGWGIMLGNASSYWMINCQEF